jgi:hypothetical protein
MAPFRTRYNAKIGPYDVEMIVCLSHLAQAISSQYSVAKNGILAREDA